MAASLSVGRRFDPAPATNKKWSIMSSGRLKLSIDAFYDSDAGVWVATSTEGRMTTEAPSRDGLIERLKVIVPDVLESRLGHAPVMFLFSSIGRNCAPLSRRN